MLYSRNLSHLANVMYTAKVTSFPDHLALQLYNRRCKTRGHWLVCRTVCLSTSATPPRFRWYLYCLLAEANLWFALYSAAAGIEPATSCRKSNSLTTAPPNRILQSYYLPHCHSIHTRTQLCPPSLDTQGVCYDYNILSFPHWFRPPFDLCHWTWCLEQPYSTEEEEKENHINSAIHRVVARPLLLLSRRWLAPITLAYTKASMPSVLVAGRLLCRTRHFFPGGGWNHRQYSLHRPQRDGQAEYAWVARKILEC